MEVVDNQLEANDPPCTKDTYGLMESQDYVYPVDGWLQDYEMELENAGKYEERIAFCQKILEMFDWEDEGKA